MSLVSIGAINFSFVQGRVAFGSVTYTSKNTSLSVVSGFITLRYWRRSVRTGIKNPENLPTRVNVELSGVEFQARGDCFFSRRLSCATPDFQQ